MTSQPLREIADIVRGISFPKDAKSLVPRDGDIACLRTTNVQREVEWDDLWFVPNEHVKRPEQFVQPGDILISTANSYELVGKVALVSAVPRRATLGAFISLIRPRPGVDPKYLYHQLAWGRTQSRIRETASTTTNISNVSSKKLAALELDLPPLDQQRRIVSELERQFSRLDEAVANLKRVKANLKRYKTAVLKAAIEGRLMPTEAELARREGRDFESGQELLRRVLEIRRRLWKGKARYEDPPLPDSTELPDLPEGWAWARLESLASIKGGITVDKKRRDPTSRSVPYLRVANVQRGHLDLAEIKVIDAPQADIEELRLRHGDILFNEGGDRDKLGRGWIWESQLPECIHQNHVFRARLFSEEVSPKLVSWWGNTFGRDYFLREGKQTTNLASINMTKLSAFPVPVPPPFEQRRIVVEVEQRLSFIDALRYETDANLKRAARLRDAILRTAFSPA